ncbi:MAG: hypothetical protein FVQ82_12665 [Planctomycetes bacterium]|nr:hypothetical protein [Planctomycetota bacterium]
MDIMFGAVADYLIDQSLQIAVLFGVVGLLCFLLRRASSHVRYLLWGLVIAKCIFPSVMKVSLAVLPEKEIVIAAAQPEFVAEPYAVSTGVSLHADLTDFEPVAAIPYEPSFMDRLAEIETIEWVGIVWAFGSVLFLVGVCFRAWRLNRRLRSLRRVAELDICVAGDDGINVWQIDGIGQPFVWGILRGSVYVPGNFGECGSVGDQRGILMHEFAHVRRFDAGVNVLQIVAQGLFWFHPLVWIANTMVRREREKCCDEAAIAKLKSVPRDYGNAIIDTLTREYESNIPVPSLAVAGPAKNIEDRLKTIMRPGKKFYARCGVFALITIILLAMFALPVGCVLTARDNNENDSVIDNDKTEVKKESKFSSEVEAAIKDFQSEKGRMGFRYKAAEILMPYLKAGMLKTEIEALLGEPDSKHSSPNVSAYTVFYSQVIHIYYDDKGKVILIDGPGIKFLSSYDRNWAFIKVGMTKKQVNTRLGHNQKEMDGGKKWQFHAQRDDPHYYNIYFDENDKVIKFAKTKAEFRSYDIRELLRLANIQFLRDDKISNADVEAAVVLTKEIVTHIKNNIFPTVKIDDEFKATVRRFGTSIVMVHHAPSVHEKVEAYLEKMEKELKAKGETADWTEEEKILHTWRDPKNVEAAAKICLKRRLSKKQVIGILGRPMYPDIGGDDHIAYSPAPSYVFDFYFDDDGKVFHVDGPWMKFLSSYDRNWTFIRIGMTKKQVNGRLGHNQKEMDGGKKWEFHAQRDDPHFYNIFFDENDKVIKLEKSKVKASGKSLMFYGLDLSKAAVTYKPYEITDFFEPQEAGYQKYYIRDKVEEIYIADDGAVYYLPKKNVFYVLQRGLFGSGSAYYYGPFKGDPHKVLKGLPVKPGDQQVSIETRFIIANENFTEDIGLNAINIAVKKMEKPYFWPEVSYEFFEGSKPMEDEKAAEILRHMGVDDSDDIVFKYVDDGDLILEFLRRASSTSSEFHILTAPKISVVDGEPGHISIVKENKYVSGYKQVEGNKGKTFEAVTKTLETGIKLDLLPKVLKDSGNVDITFYSLMIDDVSIQERKHKSGKTYNVPELLKTQLRGRFEIPRGKTLIIAGVKLLDKDGNTNNDYDHGGTKISFKDIKDPRVHRRWLGIKKKPVKNNMIILVTPTVK